MRLLVVALLLSSILSGCAVYQGQPLPVRSNLEVSLPPAAGHPLSMSEAASLAVLRSPNLLTERRKADVAQAQAYAAGLLPDPQLSASVDHPTVQGIALVNGYALGLSQDLQSLLTEPSRAESADAKQTQAKLDLLWAEWQTIQKVGTLFAQKAYADRKAASLTETANILEDQSDRSARALASHDTTIDVAGSDLSAAIDVASQRDVAARAAIAADADLKTELNLSPIAPLVLTDPGVPRQMSKKEVQDALENVVRVRPDLLALQAGYHAQEEAVWTAILEQFPAINVGFNRAADTSNIQTNGLSVTLNIPIFGSTQAKIRSERATRAQLRTEYQTRLDQTETDAWRIWDSLNLLHAQIDRLEKSLPKLQMMAAAGRAAYRAGNLAPATYALLRTTLTTRQSEVFDLKATLWNDTIALRAVLAISPLIPGTSE